MRKLVISLAFCLFLTRTNGQFGGFSGSNFGGGASHHFGDTGYGLVQQGHSNQGQSHHGLQDNLNENKQQHHSEHDFGSQGAQLEQGGHKGAAQNYHDKGSYSKEKKYGYEKAYGYEKESKHHNKGGQSQTYGDSYNHQKQYGHHNKGAQGALAHHLNKNLHKYGGQSYANAGQGLNKNYHQKLGSGNNGHYSQQFNKNFDNGRFYGGGLKFNSGLRDSAIYPKWKYVGGLHGLGGLRGYGLGRYGYGGNNFDVNRFIDNGDAGLSYGDDVADIDDLAINTKVYSGAPVGGLTGLGGGVGGQQSYSYFVKHESS